MRTRWHDITSEERDKLELKLGIIDQAEANRRAWARIHYEQLRRRSLTPIY